MPEILDLAEFDLVNLSSDRVLALSACFDRIFHATVGLDALGVDEMVVSSEVFDTRPDVFVAVIYYQCVIVNLNMLSYYLNSIAIFVVLCLCYSRSFLTNFLRLRISKYLTFEYFSPFIV